MALQKVQELTAKHQPNEDQMSELYIAFKEKQAEIEAYEAGNPERRQAIRGFALSIEPIMNRKKVTR